MTIKNKLIACAGTLAMFFSITSNAVIVQFDGVAPDFYGSYSDSGVTITGSSDLVFGAKGLGVDGGVSFGGADPLTRYNLIDSGESLTFSFSPGVIATQVRLYKNGFTFGDTSAIDGLFFSGYDGLGNNYSGSLDVGVTGVGGAGYQNIIGYGSSSVLSSTNLTEFSITAPDDGYSYGFIEFRLMDNPSPVPVPAAVWLFGSGLLGFLSLSKRKT